MTAPAGAGTDGPRGSGDAEGAPTPADGPPVRLGVDVGGTFTDVVLFVGDERTTAKVPTTDDQHVGVRRGVRTACEAAGVAPAAVDEFRHATTVSVNALLEAPDGDAGRTALVATEGFADVVEIGRQDRPALYDHTARKPHPLVPRDLRFGLAERATTEGVVDPVDEGDVRAVAERIRDADPPVESVAVALLHAYADPANEATAAEVLRTELDVPVTASHEVLPTVREYERTATTVAEAAVTPVVGRYLRRLAAVADDAGLPAPAVMQSGGGVADAETVAENAVTTVLSGPAAGVVGAATAAGHAQSEGLVTLDMGGTSTDVSLVRDGEAARTTEATVAGRPVHVPMVDVETVGAGGGSVAWVDRGGALRVGPRSADAEPGPACYGRGGSEPTVTDANLVLGYLGPETGVGEGDGLDVDAARRALADLAREAALLGEDGAGTDVDGEGERAAVVAAARGVRRVADARTTGAVRRATVERGHDPRSFALAAFGGAGPMHAASLADRLGMARVVVPPAEGVRSAVGLLVADETHDAVRTRRVRLDDADPGALAAAYDDLAAAALADASDPDAASVDLAAACQYAGQSHELTVPVSAPVEPAAVAATYHEAHERVRGYRLSDEPVVLVTLQATATVPREGPTPAWEPAHDPLTGRREAHFGDAAEPVETRVYDRERVPPGASYDGPAVFEGGESTVVLPPGWSADVAGDGTLVLEGAT
ncbi:MAG: hydantoinase/oxoprolinase family protein [Halobacteriaceae archaeon]